MIHGIPSRQTVHRTLPIWLMLGLLLVLAGCQSLQEREEKNALSKTLNSYAAGMRWGNPAQAYAFLEPELAKIAQPPKGIDNIRVTAYKVLQPALIAPDMSARQSVAIQYVFMDRQVEKTLIDHQLWRFDKAQERWLRANPIPAFR